MTYKDVKQSGYYWFKPRRAFSVECYRFSEFPIMVEYDATDEVVLVMGIENCWTLDSRFQGEFIRPLVCEGL